MVYTLGPSDFELRIKLVELDELKIHEETISSLLRDLADSIESDGYLKHPVITDEETNVVLDGMHRVAALEELDCQFALVCSVDYKNPRVKLGVWNRLFCEVEMELILELLDGMGFKAEPCGPREAEDIPARGGAKSALISGDESYLIEDGEDLQEIYKKVSELENELTDKGISVDYETREDALRKIKSNGIALLIPIPRKDDVINIAHSNSVFAHKTTRHVIPARPMGVQVPLEWLMGEKDLEEADKELTRQLEKREIERLSPGNLFEGRRYEEELFIFK